MLFIPLGVLDTCFAVALSLVATRVPRFRVPTKPGTEEGGLPLLRLRGSQRKQARYILRGYQKLVSNALMFLPCALRSTVIGGGVICGHELWRTSTYFSNVPGKTLTGVSLFRACVAESSSSRGV